MNHPNPRRCIDFSLRDSASEKGAFDLNLRLAELEHFERFEVNIEAQTEMFLGAQEMAFLGLSFTASLQNATRSVTKLHINLEDMNC